MNELVPLAAAPHRTSSLRVGRALARLEGQTILSRAHIEGQADLQIARVEAVAAVGASALQSVALVTQLEQQLAQQMPLAASRLQAIGDMTALAAAEVVADTTRRVRRC